MIKDWDEIREMLQKKCTHKNSKGMVDGDLSLSLSLSLSDDPFWCQDLHIYIWVFEPSSITASW
jgi:hypothetical protein